MLRVLPNFSVSGELAMGFVYISCGLSEKY